MEKSIKRKIGVLVILGMFAAIALSQVAAVDVQDTYIDMDDGEWIGLSDVEGRIIFDDLGATDEIEILGAHVGIGTTTPDKLLHLGDDTSDIDGELRFEASNGEYVDLGITTSDNFYITGGNVGIGTVSPTSALEVNGDIEVQDDDWIGIGSSSERIIFDSNGDDIELIGGNVGIGTTGPVATLSVAGGATVGLTWSYTNPPPINGMIVEGDVGIGKAVPLAKAHIEQTAAADAFRVDDQASDATPFLIDQDGNVGIGTTSPDTELHVNGYIKQKVTTSNVANPPSDASLDLLFGTPASNGDGWTAYLKDSDSNNFYQIVAVGIQWYIFDATLAT